MEDLVLAGMFDESKRAQAAVWLDAALTEVWSLEEWQWRYSTVAVDAVASTREAANVPTDIATAVYLLNPDSDPLRPIQDLTVYYGLYGDADSGDPEAFTMRHKTLLFGPVPQTAGVYTLLYERERPTLSAPASTTGLPNGTDMAVVFRAKAMGGQMYGIPLWQGHLDASDRLLVGMQRQWLSPVRGEAEQARPYRPV